MASELGLGTLAPRCAAASFGRYEGNPGTLGDFRHLPTFGAPAPALLGFDGDIVDFCERALKDEDDSDENHAYMCKHVNFNILNLVGSHVPCETPVPFPSVWWHGGIGDTAATPGPSFARLVGRATPIRAYPLPVADSICRNLEWQVCAAKGELPGQVNPHIVFATAPNSLVLDSGHQPLDRCGGWVPPKVRRKGAVGWANDDIYFLEVCLFNQICSNGPDLFRLGVGEQFTCDFSTDGFDELRLILSHPVAPEFMGTSACSPHREEEDEEDRGAVTCAKCWLIHEGRGDCSSRAGCHSELCNFCTNAPRAR